MSVKTGHEANAAFRRALDTGSRCPRCDRYFTSALCPSPACSELASTAGALGRRMSGLGWAPQAPVTLPEHLASQEWELPLAPRYFPPPTPSRGRTVFIGIGIGLAVLMVSAVSVFLATGTHVSVKSVVNAVPSPVPTFPASWDPRVQPIVDFVQSQRGLTFKHPVTVNFLTAAQYSASVRTSPLSRAGQASSQQEAGLYRALGMASGTIDLGGSDNQLADNGTLAYYSPRTKQVDVRGTDLTVGLRVTLAHELTHALQDQYFELSRVDAMSTSGQQTGFQTLYEGDAVRVQDAYVRAMSTADQTAYANESTTQKDNATAGLADVPPALVTLFGAPYELGPELLKVLIAKGGNSAVDDAFRSPPVDELQVLDPYLYLSRQQPLAVPAPSLGKGEKRFDGGDFGALSWYVVLSQRIDPHLALPAADAWGGDAYVAYTSNQRSCVRARIVASTAAGVAPLLSAFNAWAQAMPPGDSIAPSANGIVLSACDPGPGANLAPISTAADALVLPVARTEFTLGATSAGAPLSFARCAANKVVQSYGEAPLLDPSGAAFTSSAGQAKLQQVVAPCRPAA